MLPQKYSSSTLFVCATSWANVYKQKFITIYVMLLPFYMICVEFQCFSMNKVWNTSLPLFKFNMIYSLAQVQLLFRWCFSSWSRKLAHWRACIIFFLFIKVFCRRNLVVSTKDIKKHNFLPWNYKVVSAFWAVFRYWASKFLRSIDSFCRTLFVF